MLYSGFLSSNIQTFYTQKNQLYIFPVQGLSFLARYVNLVPWLDTILDYTLHHLRKHFIWSGTPTEIKINTVRFTFLWKYFSAEIVLDGRPVFRRNHWIQLQVTLYCYWLFIQAWKHSKILLTPMASMRMTSAIRVSQCISQYIQLDENGHQPMKNRLFIDHIKQYVITPSMSFSVTPFLHLVTDTYLSMIPLVCPRHLPLGC